MVFAVDGEKAKYRYPGYTGTTADATRCFMYVHPSSEKLVDHNEMEHGEHSDVATGSFQIPTSFFLRGNITLKMAEHYKSL
jgi:hypothetical protein